MTRKIVVLFAASLIACQPDAPASSATAEADAGARPADTTSGTAGGATMETPRDTDVAGILFLGTSLTAGYGVGADAAYPALIQARIDSAGLPYRVINAGLSGETSAGGLRRLDWSLQDSIAVLVLELGANDGLRGLPIEQLRENLDAILRRTRERYPDVRLVIAGMEAPPNLGNRYTRRFRETFVELADEHDAALIPFLLDGVAAEPAYNQSDGIHPNESGHRVLATNVWDVLEPLLKE